MQHVSYSLQSEERSVSGAAALHLAAYLFYTHEFERCRSILERHLNATDHWEDLRPERAQTLLGFVLLEQQSQEVPELQDAYELRRAVQLFDAVLQQDPNDLEV